MGLERELLEPVHGAWAKPAWFWLGGEAGWWVGGAGAGLAWFWLGGKQGGGWEGLGGIVQNMVAATLAKPVGAFLLT